MLSSGLFDACFRAACLKSLKSKVRFMQVVKKCLDLLVVESQESSSSIKPKLLWCRLCPYKTSRNCPDLP